MVNRAARTSDADFSQARTFAQVEFFGVPVPKDMTGGAAAGRVCGRILLHQRLQGAQDPLLRENDAPKELYNSYDLLFN